MINSKVTIFLLLAFSATCMGYASNILHPKSNALINLDNYDPSVRPPGPPSNPDAPVNVSINLFVKRITGPNHRWNDYTIEMFFREEWVDSRISFKDVAEISTSEVDKFWRPDVFFWNERRAHVHGMMKPNQYMLWKPNGKVRLSSRLTVGLTCPLSLWKFPFDSQRCVMRMESYGYSAKDLNLNWLDDDSVQISENIDLPEFKLEEIDTTTCHSTTKSGKKYSCLQVSFQFKRNYVTYISGYYIPLLLVVVASWTTFWIPAFRGETRIAVGLLTCLVSAIWLFQKGNSLCLPGITSLDIWVGVSVFFVFAAFFEFVLVVYHQSQEKDLENTKLGEPVKVVKILGIKMQPSDGIIDGFSKVVFPTTYLLFNFVLFCFLI